jgi:hypothetical protein
MTLPFATIYDVVKDLIGLYNNKKIKKIPVNKFISQIETKLKMRLDEESKEKILNDVESDGIAKILSESNGNRFVVFGGIY